MSDHQSVEQRNERSSAERNVRDGQRGGIGRGLGGGSGKSDPFGRSGGVVAQGREWTWHGAAMSFSVMWLK
jgi:hypothetical protein